MLFRTNKLALFAMQNLSSRWKEITNLTESHYAQLTKEHYFVDNDIMKGKLLPDARTAVGDKKTWQSFQEWQRRKYLLHFTSPVSNGARPLWFVSTKLKTLCSSLFSLRLRWKVANCFSGMERHLWQIHKPHWTECWLLIHQCSILVRWLGLR